MLGFQVAALVIFAATIVGVVVLVLYPQQLRVPGTQWRLGIKYWMVPLLGCLLMLACGSLNGRGIVAGILGDEHIEPYAIVILFMSLAYISSSLDSTGAFAWLALHMTRASKGRGRVLYVLYFTLSSTITLVTNNDVVIMTLTPIVMYCAAATGVDPVPFLVAEFTAAHIWSMATYIGNPTNVIVAQAQRLTFLGFSKWTLLPTVGASLVCLVWLMVTHYSRIPRTLTIPQLAPAAMLSDLPGAIFGTVNALGCLALLAAASNLHWPIWVVALACAGLHLLYNFVAYVVLLQGKPGELEVPPGQVPTDVGGSGDSCHKTAGPAAKVDIDLVVDAQPAASQPSAGPSSLHLEQAGHQALLVQPAGQGASCIQLVSIAVEKPHTQQQQQQQLPGSSSGHGLAITPGAASDNAACQPPLAAAESAGGQLQRPAQSHPSGDEAAAAAATAAGPEGAMLAPAPLSPAAAAAAGTLPTQPSSPVSRPASAASGAPRGALEIRRPSFWGGLLQQPWEVVPFILGMFVLVEGLAMAGWVDLFAAGMAQCCKPGVGAALFCTGAVSTVLANLMNNQPMTIFMTRVVMSPAFEGVVQDERVRQGAAFALVAASNLGANITVLGALAGIMWMVILKRQGLEGFGYMQFLRVLAPVGLVGLVVTLLLFWLELAVFP